MEPSSGIGQRWSPSTSVRPESGDSGTPMHRPLRPCWPRARSRRSSWAPAPGMSRAAGRPWSPRSATSAGPVSARRRSPPSTWRSGTSRRAAWICPWSTCSAGRGIASRHTAAAASPATTIAELARQLGGWAADGFAMVKMKVGRDQARDPDRVGSPGRPSARTSTLFVDANGAYDRKGAIAAADRFRGCRRLMVRGARQLGRHRRAAVRARPRAGRHARWRRANTAGISSRSAGSSKRAPSTSSRPTRPAVSGSPDS